jgi:PKD repeat protein
MDTNYLFVPAYSVDQKISARLKDKCLPTELILLDSLAGMNDDLHEWQALGFTIKALGFQTGLYVSSLPSGATSIPIKHTVQTPEGCIATKTIDIPVTAPIAKYSVTRFAICDTPVFYFKAFPDSSKSALPLTYKWTTSNGHSFTQQNFNRKFGDIGVHTFTLEIKDRNGCSNFYTDSFEVSPNMLQPLFSATPRGAFCPPLKVKFTDLSKTFSSEIVGWDWDFGDGTGSKLKDPEKLYLVPGVYDITLKVTSRSGCTAILKKPGFIIVSGPKGTYDFDRGNACLPHKVQFRANTAPGVSMEWDLGDGTVR